LVDFRLLTSVCNAWQRSWTHNLRRVGENYFQPLVGQSS